VVTSKSHDHERTVVARVKKRGADAPLRLTKFRD